MSAADKSVLDAIEGLGTGYEETRFEVPSFGECFSYIAQEGFIDEALQPYDWYKALVVAGATFHGFPDEYTGNIASTSAIRDPDDERSARQWALVDKVITTHC